MTTQERITALIEGWKQSIDVQKHFNDLILNIRERAITVLGAGLVATAFLIKENYVLAQPIRWAHLVAGVSFMIIVILLIIIKLGIHKWKSSSSTLSPNTTEPIISRWFLFLVIPYLSIFLIYLYLRQDKEFEMTWLYSPIIGFPSIGGLILIALSFVWLAFYFLDRFWYHRLLKGAVNHGILIEAALKQEIPEFTLGEYISKESSVYISLKVNWLSKLRIDSSSKLDIFYFSIFLTLFSIGIILLKQPKDIVKGGEKDSFSINLIPISPDSLRRMNNRNDSLIKVNKVLEDKVVEFETRIKIESLIKKKELMLPIPIIPGAQILDTTNAPKLGN